MNNYCKNCKTRTKKGTCYNYCSKLRKIIDKAMDCKNCDELEPRIYKGFKKSTFNKKSTFKSGTLKKKSNKLARLERKRESVFTNNLETCYLCGKKKQEIHEIYAGRNRLNSIKYNLTIPLCHECHSKNQNNHSFNENWHKKGQEYFENNIGTRNQFISIFRRNYLDK